MDLRKRLAHICDDGQRVGRGRGIDADEHGLRSIEYRGGIRVLGAELDIGDLPQTDERVAPGQHHEPAERVRIAERGLGVDIRLDEVAFDLPRRRGEIVVGQSLADIERRHPERGHAVGIKPDAHREHLAAEHLGLSHAVDGLQLRLYHALEVVADLGRGHHVRVERQIEQRVALARLLGDDGVVGLARQNALHLGELRQHVGHGAVGIGIQPEVERDRAHILVGRCGERVDAFGARHRLLDRHGDEALNEVGVGAGIGREDRDRRIGQLGILPDGQLESRLRADEQDQQAHHRGKHRPFDKEIGEAHVLTASASPPGASAHRRCRS